MEDKLTINENFAKSYNKYRRAEELQKLEDSCKKYGDESSSSESEDEDAEAINSKFEKKFFHVLAQLKSKDPALYNQEEKFFNEDSSEESDSDGNETSSSKKKKEKPLYLKEYERNIALEGVFNHDEPDRGKEKGTALADAPDSYYGQLAAIKKSFTEAAKEHDEKFQDGGGIDSLIKKKSAKKADDDSKDTKLDDLDDYWKDSKLDDKEKYLRDFLLEKKYLASDSEDEKVTTDLLLEEDDGFAEKQEMFEFKYNTRLENPDHHFIKSYPRIIASSVRRKDERRKKRRDEREKRKTDQKKRKIEELARLKRLKRESIMEKIDRLKEASGNTDLGFSEHDIDDDFNPEEHDKRMQELFNEEFYAEAEDEKPQFSDIGEDEFGEETNWDDYKNYDDDDENLPACEQPDFVMDCDYVPEENSNKSKRQLKREMKNMKKKKSKDSNFASNAGYDEPTAYGDGYDENLPACEQPDFVMDCDYVPEKKSKRQLKKEKRAMTEEQFLHKMNDEKAALGEKSVNDHLEEYYAMDFDDIIGDMPCRFRYRTVAATNFGLSTEDILLADNPTLNSWCPLSRVVAHRLPEDEFYLRQKYARKARSKRRKVFGKFYDELKDKKSLREMKEMENEESNDSDEEKVVEDAEKDDTAQPKTKTVGTKDSKPPKQPKKSDIDADVTSKKRKKLSARQRRRNRERQETEPKKVAQKGTWIKKQTNESFQRLARIEPSVLKAYGLKPKRVIRQAKHDFVNQKKKKKHQR